MSNDAPVMAWMDPTTGFLPGAGHPAGEIRLVQETTVGRRARLLAGTEGCEEGYTFVETSYSMSFI